jgi:dienelactone hydrolase
MTMAPTALDIEAPPVAAAGVRRTAFYLDCQGQPLFAWLHAPEEASRTGRGVVLCPPLGHEQVHAHRSVRHLADAIARAGMTALRFDYHGTGDSAGTDEDPDRLGAWPASIRAALGWLRQFTGGPVNLFGLRLGAYLALHAACEEEIDSLVLWAPVAGRAFAREMKVLASAPPGPSGDIEAMGFTFTRQTLDSLSRLGTPAGRPRCRRVLLAAPEDAPPSTGLGEYLAGAALPTTEIPLIGCAEMLAEPHRTRVPRQAIEQTVTWLLADAPPPPVTAGLALAFELPERAVVCPGVSERLVSPPGEGPLFGVLSEPATAASPDLPLVLMLNAGSSHRVGPGRLHVHLARRLAGLGVRSLRLDLEGLGDSVTENAHLENYPYPPTGFRDIERALHHARSSLGAGRVVLLGLCSAAYYAFQSVVHLRSPALVECVLLNAQDFYWQEGISLDDPPTLPVAALHYYMTAARQPAKWLRLLTGKSKIGVAGALRLLWQRWRLRRQRPSPSPGEEGGCDLRGHPPQGDLAADLGRAASAGRHLTFAFADSDPGYRILTFHAARKVKQLSRAGKIDVLFVGDADHTFSMRGPRAKLIEVLGDHLCRRYGQGAGL